MYKVGVVGDKDSVMGFLALGIDIFPVYEADEIKKTIHRLVEEEYAIIYITEDAALMSGDFISKYKDSRLPAIIVVPGISGSKGIGLNEIRQSANRAIGVDILFGND